MQDFNAKPIFSSAEVQQLRKLLSESINELEIESNYRKKVAHTFKKYGNRKDWISDEWKLHFKARAKIKKIAALQAKMKAFDVLY